MTSATQPAPGPEHKKLGVFLGRWHTTGEVAATESEPAAESGFDRDLSVRHYTVVR